ncbi:hypothetical protein ACFSKU_10000 [Pontibacter silvestris]|uniref:Uncharacterized protein n=1 Tax=Pontibacter silvestris TaxID=2305183 RepID=A0ABW4WZT1_9BACT|nr:hypothetical protein [Pontibacter silvestris]MCC9136829.1 hypothetical protein [Pontibacter silvestris]
MPLGSRSQFDKYPEELGFLESIKNNKLQPTTLKKMAIDKMDSGMTSSKIILH